MQKKFTTALTALAAIVAIVIGLSACSTTQKIDMSKVTAVIDVRTPAEYAAGHLQGSVNVDVEGTEFVATISALDTNGVYVLYCHSGRRAGIALETMTSMGFKNVTNAGGIEAASTATGLSIVQ